MELRRAARMGKDLMLDVSYISTRGLDIVVNSFSHGLTFDVSHDYASYLSDAGNINGGGNSDFQNDACVACNWGPTPDDYRHVLSVNHLYQLPFGPKRTYLHNGWSSKVLGNWNINGIWSANTGGRFTPILGTNVSNSSGGGDQRPNRIASGVLPSGRSIYDWFNTAAFVAPPTYSLGNSGTGILTGPGLFNVNLDASIGTSSAGVISGTGHARILQASLKVIF